MPTGVMVTKIPAWEARCGRASALLGLGFGLGHAFHVLARALGDVLPLTRVVVGLVLACARVRACEVGAVVLARLGDAVALFLVLALSGHLACHAEREHRSQCRRNDQTLIHGRCSLGDGGSWRRAAPSAICRPACRVLTSGPGSCTPDHASAV